MFSSQKNLDRIQYICHRISFRKSKALEHVILKNLKGFTKPFKKALTILRFNESVWQKNLKNSRGS